MRLHKKYKLVAKLILIIATIMMATTACFAGKIYIPEGWKLLAQDTIPLKDFTAVYYIIDSAGYRWNPGNVLIIYKNNQEVMAIDEGWAGLKNICTILGPKSTERARINDYDDDGGITTAHYAINTNMCYIGDINGDSIDEIIIDIFTGGANCCFTTRVYAVKDSLEELLNFDMIAQDCGFIDIDNDSIPEVFTWDNNWTGWRSDYTSWKAYLPQIIWRWDGHKYRVANFKFADYLIKQNNLDSYKISTKDSLQKSQEFYGEGIWGPMINNYYAGRADLADSMFNAGWPDQDTMKLKIYEQFQQQLRWSEYWPQVLESKW